MPVCKMCKRDLPEIDFHKQGPRNKKRRAVCKFCTNERNKIYRERDKKKKGKPKTAIEAELNAGGESKMLPPWPEPIKIGNEVTISISVDGRGDKSRNTTILFTGIVIWKDCLKATLRGRNYKRTIDRIDLHMGRVRVL